MQHLWAPRMCCKQGTCAILKSLRCNTYKKHRGVVLLWLTRNPFGVRQLAAAFPTWRSHRGETYGLLGFLRSDSIQRQNIPQRHNALEVMYVGAADNRQEVNLTRSHAIQGHVKRVVRMDVRKIVGFHEFTQPLVCQTIAVRPFQALQADDA